MASNSHREAQKLLRPVALASGVLLLGGCQFQPGPLSARSVREGDDEVVTVQLSGADAETIKKRQLYFSVVVRSCVSKERGYPAESYINGKRASEFTFSTAPGVVEVSGRVPGRIFDSYDRPCAFLRGGAYFTGKILSAPVPIKRVPRAGPNNSSKPTPRRGAA
jgi:hypothetical protein